MDASRFLNKNGGRNEEFSRYPENMNRYMPIVEPTYSQHLIKTPELNITNGRIPHRLIIDSKDRDPKYLEPNNYVVQLIHEYRNVISLELVQACIPYTGFTINQYNNKIFFQESSDELLVAEIPPGDYNIASDLATAIQTALNNIGNSIYTVTSNINTRKFTFYSDLSGGDHIFRLVFCGCECGDSNVCQLCRKNNNSQNYKKGSIGYKIGFDKINLLYARGAVSLIEMIDDTHLKLTICNGNLNEDFNESGNITFEKTFGILFHYILLNNTQLIIDSTELNIENALENLTNSKLFASKYISTGVWDLEDEQYIILDIQEAELIESNNKNTANKFAVIIFNVPHGEKQLLSTGSLPRRGDEKYYNPPNSKIDRLTIKFLTRNGDLYDFNGKDHVLIFDIITLNSPGKYNNSLTT